MMFIYGIIAYSLSHCACSFSSAKKQVIDLQKKVPIAGNMMNARDYVADVHGAEVTMDSIGNSIGNSIGKQ